MLYALACPAALGRSRAAPCVVSPPVLTVLAGWWESLLLEYPHLGQRTHSHSMFEWGRVEHHKWRLGMSRIRLGTYFESPIGYPLSIWKAHGSIFS